MNSILVKKIQEIYHDPRRTRRASTNAKLTASRSLSPSSPSAVEAAIIRFFSSAEFDTFLKSATCTCEWLGFKHWKFEAYIQRIGEESENAWPRP